MVLPLILLVLAGLSAAVVAYGANPYWAQFHGGLELIIMSRRLQGPLIALVLVLCIALLVYIVSGKKRGWWLVGLAPILALFAHRFVLDPDRFFYVNRQPSFVSADQATFVADDDWVIGVAGQPDVTAYPFAALYSAPLVIQTGQQPPMILMWSPFANRALALEIDRSVKSEELEIVSMPANALLVYNARFGQFINGITGKTLKGEQPNGFGKALAATKTTWKQWRLAYPQTRVLVPLQTGRTQPVPRRPIRPFYPMPADVAGTQSANSTVAFLNSDSPTAVLDSDITSAPANFENGGVPILLMRDRATGFIKAFRRQTGGDLTPIFKAKHFAKFPQAHMADSDSGSAWTNDGVAVSGPLKGQRLASLEVDDGIYLGVLRAWYPQIALLNPLAQQP